jgi:hypothetical protein
MESRFGTWHRLFQGFSFLGAVLFLASCQPETPQVEVEVGHAVSDIGAPAAAELLRTLVGRLTGAMQDGGPVSAIEFCSSEAIPLTRDVGSGLEGGLTLKRTSFRYRNPANAPDEAEEEALLYFEDAIQAGESPSAGYVQRVSEEEYRYYHPLYLGEVCLQCHGARESISPEVLVALDDRYPADLATGYRAGDFRGVVRVSVPARLLDIQEEG